MVLGKSFAPPQYFANLIFKIKCFSCKHVSVFNRNMKKPDKFLLKLSAFFRAYHSVAGRCCQIQVHECCNVTLNGIQMYRGIVQSKRSDAFLSDESLIKKHWFGTRCLHLKCLLKLTAYLLLHLARTNHSHADVSRVIVYCLSDVCLNF
jgi:hypothetical protein